MPKGLVADRRLFLAKDEETVVEADDERARFLLAAEGRIIPDAECERLGLTVEDGKIIRKGEAKQAAKPQDKQRAPAKNKGK